MCPSAKCIYLSIFVAFVGCATDEGSYKWRQFAGAVGFEEAERYCKNLDEIYRGKLATSIFDTLILATAPPAGASGYSKGMAERQQGQAGMDMESCMNKNGWKKIPI